MLAFLPILRILHIIATTGANTPTNHVTEYISFIDRVLNNQYNWSNLFQDSFWAGGHFYLTHYPARIFIVLISEWNIYVELYAGLFLVFLFVILIYKAISFNLPNSCKNGVLLLFLCSFLFSPMTIDIFTSDDQSMPIGTTLFGLGLGIWGITRFVNCWLGIIIGAVGAIISAWSWGAGLICFPAFFLGLITLNYNKLRYYFWFYRT